MKVSINYNLSGNNSLIFAVSLFFSFLLYILTSFNLLTIFGLSFFLFLFLRMINEMGKSIPMRELMSMLLLIQLFISPLIAYHYFDNKAHFKMYVPEVVYMSYAIPAVLFFILGLFIPIFNLKLNYTNVFNELNVICNKKMEKFAFLFIIIGISTILFRDIAPLSLAFILYLMKLLRFIGAFILLFSKNKFKYLWIGLVFSQFSYEIISGGVFYDLFVWVFFLYMLLETKLKSSLIRKLTIVFIGFFVIYFIQSIKADFRNESWNKNNSKESSEVFFETIEKKSNENDIFDNENDLDRFISRLNTGWILSKVMENTPRKTSFTNGETLKQDIISVLLPRFLFPNKAKTGGKENQKKFTKFTGRRLIGNTTMRIGAVSDSYINFGIIGGIITMFFLGLIFNCILFIINKMSIHNPIFLLWIPLIFAYAIRMSDIQVILNYTVKATVFVLILNFLFFSKQKKIRAL